MSALGRRALAVAGLFLSIGLLAALTASPALAVQGHVFSTSFGTAGSGDGQLSSPQGVAVNSTSHDVYVADTGNARIEQFSSAGTFIRTFGTFTTPAFIAIDNSGGLSNGDVYVGDTGTNLVSKFDSSGNPIVLWGSGGQLDGSTSTTPAGPFGALAGIAVDSSGNLFVYDTSANMFKFAEDGTPGTGFNSGFGVTPAGIAVDSAGNLYIVRGFPVVEKLDSTGADLGQVTDEGDFSNTTGLAINTSNNDLYVDDAGTKIRHYADTSCAASSSCQATDSFGSSDLNTAAGLAVDTSNQTVYAADTGNSRIAVFTLVTLPDQTTGSASNLAPDSATLNGTVNPGGVQLTDCHFSYVTDAAFNSTGYSDLSSGGSAPCVPAAASIAADSSDHAVSADLSGLSLETTYHFRLAAANANGASAPGADQTFTAPPAVASLSTDPATNVLISNATLNGSMDPAGQDTQYHFEYGTTTSYGQTTPSASTGAISGNTPVSAGLTGLARATVYHYRIVASNAFGTTYGSAQFFFSAPPDLPTVDDTSSSGVTQDAATLNAQVNPGFGPTVVRFQYGPATSYGTQTFPSHSIGSDGVDHPASTDLSGLTPGTTYHFRAVATNFVGTVYGPDQTFNTTDLPGIAGSAASGVSDTAATLGASLRPGFSPTTYHFEYGKTASYRSATPESASIGSDNSVHAAAAAIAGLTAGTTYHFRIVATNGIGTANGPDQTFTTAPTPVITPPPTTCKAGFVKRGGKCVKKHHHKRRHHKRSAKHG